MSVDTAGRMLKAMTEAQWQEQVTDLCDWLGLRWHHETDSRRSKKGLPDLIIIGPGGVIWAELKRETGRLTKSQREFLDDLVTAGQECYVWRPSEYDEVRRTLVRLAKPVQTSELGRSLSV